MLPLTRANSKVDQACIILCECTYWKSYIPPREYKTSKKIIMHNITSLIVTLSKETRKLNYTHLCSNDVCVCVCLCVSECCVCVYVLQWQTCREWTYQEASRSSCRLPGPGQSGRTLGCAALIATSHRAPPHSPAITRRSKTGIGIPLLTDDTSNCV